MGGLFSRKEEEEEGERTVAFGPRAAQPEPGEHPFPDNYVVITKYSNFIELWVRFTFGDFFLQAANFYFLCIGILQLIPSVSTTGGVPTTFVPLTFVYLVSLTREVVEELARRREQYAMNVGSKASVFRDGNAKAMEVPWQDIHVGDIVKVNNEEFFPCDMILLGVVHHSDGQEDTNEAARMAKITACYVDTASLDGESNLKKYTAVSSEIADLVQEESNVGKLRMQARVGPNMKDLAKFEGKMPVAGVEGATDRVHVPAGTGFEVKASMKGNAHVLLRECKLRNCAFVYGLAIYTGRQTFIKQQSKKVSMKPVFLQDAINVFVRLMFAGQMLLCLIGALAHGGFVAFAQSKDTWYLQLDDVGPVDSVLRFFTYVQVTSGFIPISLYVSMEMARLAQKFFMERDDDMYHVAPGKRKRNIRTRVRALQLNDQLGQVTHIFSDKTGTLTQNSFEFRKVTVGGFVYGAGTTEIAVISARGQARSDADRAKVAAKELILKKGVENSKRPDKIPHVNFVEEDHESRKLLAVLRGEVSTSDPVTGEDFSAQHVKDIVELFMAFVMCSTVDIEPDASEAAPGSPKEPAARPTSISGGAAASAAASAMVAAAVDAGATAVSISSSEYKLAGDSSDEVCFCYAAYEFGVKLVRRSFTARGEPQYVLSVKNFTTGEHTEVTRILGALNEYNSARQMMSVAVEDPTLDESHPERVTVYAKGSDKRIAECLLTLKSEAALDAAVSEAEASGDEARIAAAKAERTLHLRQAWMRAQTAKQCAEFSRDGLRTLAFAKRSMPRADLESWRPRLRQARDEARDLYNEHLRLYPGDESGALKKKNNKIGDVVAELERNMVYQGVVGYEDSLQEDVPNTISRLQDAGIKIYMLTGDKEGTAINIGYGVQLLTNETEMLLLTWEGRERDLFNKEAPPAADSAPPSPFASELAILNELERAFQRGNPRVNADTDDSDNGDDDGAAAASPPTPAVGSAGAEPAAASVGGSPAGVPPSADAQPAKLLDPDRPESPQISAVVAALTPVRDETTGRIDTADLKRAHDMISALRAVVRQAEHYVREAGRTTDRAQAEAIRTRVIEFTLALDLALLTVKYVGGSSRPLALVMDERSMHFFLAWPGYEEIRADSKTYPNGLDSPSLAPLKEKRASLLRLAELCRAIIGARCQPSQKRTVLELIKFEIAGSCCLAIGDGANDVEMISAGNVGVGIEGAEGNSAANAADYSIGQFRFLQKLLLVHGRWNYLRMCNLILFMFYKNALFTLCQFLYGYVSGWSGQKLYPETAAQAFNLIFTGAAVVASATLDQDVDFDSAQRFPFLFADGRERRHFSPVRAVFWLIQASYEAILILVVVAVALTVAGPDGFSMSVFEYGSVVLTMVVSVVNLRLGIETYQHEWFFVTFTVLSTAAWPGVAFLLDLSDSEGVKGLYSRMFTNGSFWFLFPVGMCIVMFPLIITRVLRTLYLPDYRNIIRETEFFIRNGQQSGTYFPMVETAAMAELRRRGGVVNDSNRDLQRASTPFDRTDCLTHCFIRLSRVPWSWACCGRCLVTCGGACGPLEESAGGAAGGAGSAPLRRSRSGTPVPSGSGKAASPGVVSPKPNADTATMLGRRAVVTWVDDVRWSEQEAKLVLWPIQEALKEKLEEEERTRLAYPYHFHLNVLIRKRIQNLVQQGRLTPASVGLQSFPDDDIVMGVEKGKGEAPAAAAAAAPAPTAAPSAAGAAGGAAGALDARARGADLTMAALREARDVDRTPFHRSRIARTAWRSAQSNLIRGTFNANSHRANFTADEKSGERLANMILDANLTRVSSRSRGAVAGGAEATGVVAAGGGGAAAAAGGGAAGAASGAAAAAASGAAAAAAAGRP